MQNLSDQPTMTLKQARTVDRPAFWVGPHEEFMFDPRTDAVFWHAFLDDQPHGPYGWGHLPRDKTVPQDGWIHWPSPQCDCEVCGYPDDAALLDDASARATHFDSSREVRGRCPCWP